MRRMLLVGAVSLACAFAASCSDDDDIPLGTGGGGGTGGNGGTGAGSGGDGGTGPIAGSGGSSGGSGSGGGGGSSGAAGSSAGAAGSGTAGSGTEPPDAGSDASNGDAGDGGGPPPCTGCMELRVPFTAINQAAFFQIVFSARSIADTAVTFRVRAETLDETGQTYVYAFGTDNSDFDQAAGTFTLINAANFTDTNTFIDLTLDFNTFSNVDFDEANVIALGLQVGSGGGLAGPTTSVLVLDSVTLTGTSGLPNMTFTSTAEGFAVNGGISVSGAEAIHHPE